MQFIKTGGPVVVARFSINVSKTKKLYLVNIMSIECK